MGVQGTDSKGRLTGRMIIENALIVAFSEAYEESRPYTQFESFILVFLELHRFVLKVRAGILEFYHGGISG